jgi:dTDP-4-amino-4,6-dideoxygalactose transaminase
MAKDRWEINREFTRPELTEIYKTYKFKDPWEIIGIFEKKVAEFAGSKYAVSTDCCTHALFLCMLYRKEARNLTAKKGVVIPNHTWWSIPQYIKFAGMKPVYKDIKWMGGYWLGDLDIWDGAVRWQTNMYQGGFHCLSFQIKKNVPIGRGGMILTDDKDAYGLLSKMRYDGRNMETDYMDRKHVVKRGFHFYMTPEDAARGILIMDAMPKEMPDAAHWKDYPDLSDSLLKHLL